MSDDQTTKPTRPAPHRGPFGGMGMPAEKSLNFWPSAKRLGARLRPEWLGLLWVGLLAIVSVTLTVIG